jgi:hypothetical protein
MFNYCFITDIKTDQKFALYFVFLYVCICIANVLPKQNTETQMKTGCVNSPLRINIEENISLE